MCPAIAGNHGFPTYFWPELLEGDVHFLTLGWHRSSHPSSHKRFPWDTALGEIFILPGRSRPEQDGPISRSHFLARTPPLLPLWRMWAFSFGEAFPVLWCSGYCGPQCPSLPLKPVAEKYIRVKIKTLWTGRNCQKWAGASCGSTLGPPLVPVPWVWTTDCEESEFLGCS